MMRRRMRRYDVAFYVPSIGALLTDRGSASAGGAETQIYLLSRALARSGLKVCLVAYALGTAVLPSSVGGVDVLVRRPYSGRRRMLGKLVEIAAIYRVIAAADAKVLVSRNAGPTVGLVALAARLVGTRFVYSSANVVDFDFARIDPKRRNLALFRLGVRLASRVVVQTDEQAALCRQRFRRNADVIRSIAEAAEAPSDGDLPDTYLWIGRLVWYKRPEAFIELARALPEARFRMIGVPVPGEDALARRVESVAAEVPNVEFFEQRTRAELLRLLSGVVAIVNTSDFEGMPNVFLEGWVRGIPALALSHDPDGVIARFDLGFFAAGDVDLLAKAARALWDGRDQRRALGDRCRRYVAEHHSASVVSEQWTSVLGLDSLGRSWAGLSEPASR